MLFSESEGGLGDHWICGRPLRNQGDPMNLWLCGWCQKGGWSYGDWFLWLWGLPDSNPDSFAPCSVSPLFLMFPSGPGLFLTILLFLHICLAKFLSFFLNKIYIFLILKTCLITCSQVEFMIKLHCSLSRFGRWVTEPVMRAGVGLQKKMMHYHLQGMGES